MREVRVLPPLAHQVKQNGPVEPESQCANKAELPAQCPLGKGRARARRRSLVLHNLAHVPHKKNRPGENFSICEITRVRNAKSLFLTLAEHPISSGTSLGLSIHGSLHCGLWLFRIC